MKNEVKILCARQNYGMTKNNLIKKPAREDKEDKEDTMMSILYQSSMMLLGKVVENTFEALLRARVKEKNYALVECT